MTFDELSLDEAKTRLAGDIRNFMALEFVVFSPWHDLDLMYADGYLGKVALATAVTGRQFVPICPKQDLIKMNDIQIWKTVMEGKKR